jgi:predicted transposase/invertase (TIGR01784 family)
MDQAIQKVQEKIDWIQGDPELLRAYLRYEKAASDEKTRINGTRREIAQKMKNRGLPVDQIAEDTGLSIEEITKL